MTAPAADYSWVSGSLLDSHLGYGITLVHGISPDEALDRLQADRQGSYTGLPRLYRRNDDVQERLDYEYGDFQLVGAAPVTGTGGEWTLIVEFNVAVGFDHPFMTRISMGTRVVAHHLNSVGKGGFHWWRDGRLLTWFEWPHDRRGDTPDALNEAIGRTGVGATDYGTAEGYFILAQELTGVHLTPGLMEHARFAAGIVALTDRARAHGWRWTDPDLGPEERLARDARIRSWARSRGIKVSDDRIHTTTTELYEACHADAPPLWFLRSPPDIDAR
ncbi:DUF6461 domain-containing protein [Actinomadura bangladeshensis]|uniref:Uncharacterized protein n=1 Tax=Actinomadura bangladeshensis TaxID=453573 RepID=A0A4R4NX19_9ACTN|nr:DUF6461 domain-containing protein [Actinomadura bangladeshensis]TDC12710.1 hypothetical protein E1284_22545 [Actinomadura bangladeshensis]